MEKNIGKTDRNIRFAIGAILIFIGLFYNFWISFIGAIVIFTGIIQFCSIYKFFNIKTK